MIKTQWTAKELFNERESSAIATRTAELLVGDTKYITALCKARSQLWWDLSDEQREEYEQEAEQWNMNGPDEELVAL